MKIVKDGVAEEDRAYAMDILCKLRAGNRVFGSPAAALSKTLSHLEENAPAKDSNEDIHYYLNNKEYEAKVSKLKKGIKGEKTLAEYFEKIIRLDKSLSDIIAIASLGSEGNGDEEYISDTDFLILYGNNILIVDSKCINTNPSIPLFVRGHGVYSAVNHDEPILEVNPATHYWKKTIANEYHKEIGYVNGCVVIINKSGAQIFKDGEWWKSDIKPLHISELVDYLKTWIDGKEPTVDLALLVTIMKHQVWAQKSTMDLTKAKRMLRV